MVIGGRSSSSPLGDAPASSRGYFIEFPMKYPELLRTITTIGGITLSQTCERMCSSAEVNMVEIETYKTVYITL